MDSPLKLIENWYLSLQTTHQDDLAGLAGHFLFEGGLKGDQPERILAFVKELDSSGLTAKEIVKKALYFIKLIDFTLEGRGTEQDWDETLDRLLSLREFAREQDDSHLVDPMLDNFHERKAGWIGVAGTWAALTAGPLNNKAIGEWYIANMKKTFK